MPPEEMVCRGVTVRIQCTGIPVTSQDVRWFKDGVPIPTNSSEKSVLCLEDLELSDGGKYRCEITQSSGAKISSNEVDISIKGWKCHFLNTDNFPPKLFKKLK
ncbi:Down syndrome cell adhesion molecule-like protein 1 [Bonamia ostreae]|uniref:Down syndrome cell adhesion molecule-like protein 1 n=1 Tax=Bonamia ostreae TaxID=126728 RepID=A0ABV2AV56_9EUKA